MASKKVTITLDERDLERIRGLVDAGSAASVSRGDHGMRNIWWNGARVGVFGSAMKWLGANWASFGEALTRA